MSHSRVTEVRAETPTRRRMDIQGLRAVAVLAVVADHLFGWPLGGFVGVDVFFVISGYVIVAGLLRSAERDGKIAWGKFYQARAKRILPASLLTLAATLVAAYLLFGQGRFISTMWDVVSAALFGSNWRFSWAGTDYFASDGPVSPVQHFWSLSIEEQFYFVIPLLIIAALVFARRFGRSPRSAFLVVLGAVFIGSAVWASIDAVANPTGAYFSTLTRAWELSTGALLAVLAPFARRLRPGARVALAWLGLTGIIAAVLLVRSGPLFPWPSALIPVLATAAVIFAGEGVADRYAPRILTNRVSTYVGNLSYSLYLWHWPVIVFLGEVVSPGSTRFFVLAVVLIAASSVASYHLWERPIHHWTRQSRPSRPRRGLIIATSAVAAGAVLAVTVGASLPARGGFVPGEAFTTHTLAQAISEAVEDKPFPDSSPPLDMPSAWMPEEMGGASGCLNPASLADLSLCTSGDGGELAVVAGDSVAMSWLPAVESALVPAGYTVHGVGLSDCPLAPVQTVLSESPERADRCNDGREEIIAGIVAMKPSLLIVSEFESAHRRVAANSALGWVEAQDTLVARFDPAVTRVVFLSPPPAGISPAVCVSKRGTTADCVKPIGSAWWEKRALEQRETLPSNAAWVDSRKWFCDEENVCPLVVGGMLTRWDSVHLSRQYAEAIGPLMADELLGR